METIPLKYNAYNNENLFTSSEVELMETNDNGFTGVHQLILFTFSEVELMETLERSPANCRISSFYFFGS